MGILFCLGLLFIPRNKVRTKNDIYYIKIGVILIFIFSTIFYYPYFSIEQQYLIKNPNIVSINQSEFSILIFLKNIMTIFGIHTSASGLVIAEFIRLFYGIVFIIGFFSILYKEKWVGLMIIIAIITISLFLYPMWRYILPFIPLLFVYGINQITKFQKINFYN